MNQRGVIDIGVILVLLAVGAAIGVVNFPQTNVERVEVIKTIEIEKPVIVEKIVEKKCEKSWYQLWK